MDDRQYEQLVRSLEHQALANPVSFRSKVLLISGAAYVALAAVLALAAVVVWLLVLLLKASHSGFVMVKLGLAVLGLAIGVAGILFVVLKAFLTRIPPPGGREITAAEAPRLFELLEKVRSKLNGPPLHRVVIDGSFNAAIAQVPRFGLFGGHRNHLIIGLPYLYGVSPREMLATLAHEYGHLAGADGKVGAWVYRQRITFHALAEKLQESEESWLNSVLVAGLRFFLPYFNAYTFVLSRQNEYLADAAASRLAGADANGVGLCRDALLGRWFAQDFWQRLYVQASEHAQPLFMPYASLRTAFAASHGDWSSQAWLKEALERRSDLHDTHPCLRDRLDAIDQTPSLPPPLQKSAAEALLGSFAGVLVKEFDAEWWQREGSGWQKHHRELAEARRTVARFSSRPLSGLSAYELHEYANALVGCQRNGDAVPVLEHLLAGSGGPFPRSRLLYGRLLLDAGRGEAGLAALAQAAAEDARLAEECIGRGYMFLLQTEGQEAAVRWAETNSPD